VAARLRTPPVLRCIGNGFLWALLRFDHGADRHGSTTDEGSALVVGVAAGTIDLLDSAAEISRHLVPQ
jgi:hypothetical protein